MKNLIASHTLNIYLKPGEVLVLNKPALVSTVLGSCVAVTMYSPTTGFAAICHAMLPENSGFTKDLRYVDTALNHIADKMVGIDTGNDLVVKLFGGAQVLNLAAENISGATIGDLNVKKAEEILGKFGYSISARDTGGRQGRKLFFCTRSGDIYLRRMRAKTNI